MPLLLRTERMNMHLYPKRHIETYVSKVYDVCHSCGCVLVKEVAWYLGWQQHGQARSRWSNMYTEDAGLTIRGMTAQWLWYHEWGWIRVELMRLEGFGAAKLESTVEPEDVGTRISACVLQECKPSLYCHNNKFSILKRLSTKYLWFT